MLRLDDAVSIHAPREGCDQARQQGMAGASRFNSRTPGGVRLKPLDPPYVNGKVSIHAPREGCDGEFTFAKLFDGVFQFTHPGRGATASGLAYCPFPSSFNSRTPGGVRRQNSI